MGQLRVTPEQLRDRAKEYRNQSDEVGHIIEKLDGLINALESEFEGNTASRFSSQYSDLRPNIVSMQQLIKDLAAFLDQKANDFENADS